MGLLAQGKVLWLTSGYDKEVSDPTKGQDFEQLSDWHFLKKDFMSLPLMVGYFGLADVILWPCSPLFLCLLVRKGKPGGKGPY